MKYIFSIIILAIGLPFNIVALFPKIAECRQMDGIVDSCKPFTRALLQLPGFDAILTNEYPTAFFVIWLFVALFSIYFGLRHYFYVRDRRGRKRTAALYVNMLFFVLHGIQVFLGWSNISTVYVFTKTFVSDFFV